MQQKLVIFVVSVVALFAAGKKALEAGRDLGLWD